MLGKYFHITCTAVAVLLSGFGFSQTITENFNHNSVSTSEDNCWIFDDVDIDDDASINTGGNRWQGQADIDGFFGATADLTSPFIQFNGSGSITFFHKMEDDEWWWTSSRLRFYLRDVDGNRFGPYFSHTYRQLSFFNRTPNGNPTNVQGESVNVTWSGYYRVEWYWNSFNSYADGLIDDISIPASYDPIVESDVVCAGETVNHTPTDAVSAGAPYNFTYSWSWVGTPGGTLTTQTTNDRTAQVDWNVGPGTYRLQADETYDNGACIGRTFYIDVTVRQRPTYTVSIDTVCEENRATISFTGALGTQPYTVRYDDGSGPVNVVTTGASMTRQLTVDATAVEIISVTDANGCEVDPGTLAIYPVTYYPKPATGPIYHN